MVSSGAPVTVASAVEERSGQQLRSTTKLMSHSSGSGHEVWFQAVWSRGAAVPSAAVQPIPGQAESSISAQPRWRRRRLLPQLQAVVLLTVPADVPAAMAV